MRTCRPRPRSASSAIATVLMFALAAAASVARGATPVAADPVGAQVMKLERGWAEERKAAAGRLALASGDARAAGALILALRDEDPVVRREAVLGLARLAATWPAKAGGAGDHPIARLAGALRDDDVRIRRGACEALGLVDDGRAEAALRVAALDLSPEVRASAAWGLGRPVRSRGSAARAALVRALADDFSSVRAEAAAGLGHAGAGEEAREPLARAARDPERPVRSAAACALARRFGDVRAVPALVEGLSAEAWTLRRQSAEALGLIGPSAASAEGGAAVAALLGAVTDLDVDVREAGARALGRLRAGAAIGTLVELLGDGQPKVRSAAGEALLAFGREARGKVEAAARHGEEARQREAAAEVLALLDAAPAGGAFAGVEP